MNNFIGEFRKLLTMVYEDQYVSKQEVGLVMDMLDKMPIHITLDLTKPIRTRGGNAVEIITCFGQGGLPIVGYIIGKGTHVHTWYPDGSSPARGDVSNGCTEHEWDLINV